MNALSDLQLRVSYANTARAEKALVSTEKKINQRVVSKTPKYEEAPPATTEPTAQILSTHTSVSPPATLKGWWKKVSEKVNWFKK